ncbi:MAG: hypothetical protein ACK46Q_16400, partial [Hyphomonas sp.]
MPDTHPPHRLDWDALDTLKFADEEALLEALLKEGALPDGVREGAVRRGRELVVQARAKGRRRGVMESFLEEFGLSNSEGL